VHATEKYDVGPLPPCQSRTRRAVLSAETGQSEETSPRLAPVLVYPSLRSWLGLTYTEEGKRNLLKAGFIECTAYRARRELCVPLCVGKEDLLNRQRDGDAQIQFSLGLYLYFIFIATPPSRLGMLVCILNILLLVVYQVKRPAIYATAEETGSAG
jgi:hypothetical protein